MTERIDQGSATEQRAALEGLVTTEPTYWTVAGEMCVYCGGADGHTGGCPWACACAALAVE